MPIGSPTLPGSPGAVPGGPALPSPPVLPPTPPTGGGGSGAAQPRLPIITRYDYSPGATATGGFLANAPTSNLLIPRPQLTAIAPGGSVSFTVTLSAPALIGLIYFANLIADVSATVTVSAGAFSQTVGVYPVDSNGPYDQIEFDSLGRPRFFVLPTPTTGQHGRRHDRRQHHSGAGRLYRHLLDLAGADRHGVRLGPDDEGSLGL